MRPRSLILVIVVIAILFMAMMWGAPALIKEEGLVIEMDLSHVDNDGMDQMDIETITVEDGSATQDAPRIGTHEMKVEVWETHKTVGGLWHKDELVKSWTFRAASQSSLDGQTVRVVVPKEDLDIAMLGSNYGVQIMFDDHPVAMSVFKVKPNYSVEVIE